MNKLTLKREISLLHLLALLTSKLFIGISIGLFFSDLAFPWSYPLLIIGVLIFLPAIYKLLKIETVTEKDLLKKVKNKKIKIKK
ncbi:MAG: hypothetical protein KJ598_00965 [Nanoarchaeota archaeon]|nr:hypothetical protein [Nanoarchaeota archaeon]MBU1643705.1 hypothetical protein [Nanoarchaeota archaeon]